jgi:hypothetical protein
VSLALGWSSVISRRGARAAAVEEAEDDEAEDADEEEEEEEDEKEEEEEEEEEDMVRGSECECARDASAGRVFSRTSAPPPAAGAAPGTARAASFSVAVAAAVAARPQVTFANCEGDQPSLQNCRIVIAAGIE